MAQNNVLQYVGARYVPAFYQNPNGTWEWLSGVQYEPLTIVKYGTNTYTSKRLVPSTIGSPNANSDYWALTGDYNGFILDLENEIKGLNVKPIEYYGGKGDGVTDNSTALQDAMSDSVDILVFSSGRYGFSQPIILDNMQIAGNGTLFTLPSFVQDSWQCFIHNSHMIMNTYMDNISIRGVKIESTLSLLGGIIQLRGTESCEINHVRMEYTGYDTWGILSFSTNRNVKISDCIIENSAQSLGGCVWVRSGLANAPESNVHIDGCILTTQSTDECIAIADSNNSPLNVTISNTSCNFGSRASFGMTVHSSASENIVNVSLSNVVMVGTQSGAAISFNPAKKSYLSMSGCTIDCPTAVNGEVLATGCYINGNTYFIIAIGCILRGKNENGSLHQSTIYGKVLNPTIIDSCHILFSGNAVAITATLDLIVKNSIIESDATGISAPSSVNPANVILIGNIVKKMTLSVNTNSRGISVGTVTGCSIVDGNIIYQKTTGEPTIGMASSMVYPGNTQGVNYTVTDFV